MLFMDSLIPAAMGHTRQSGCGVVTFLQLGQAGWLHCYPWAWLKCEIDTFPGYLADGIVSLTCNRINYFIQSHQTNQCSIQSAFLRDSRTKNPQAKQCYFSWYRLSRVANIYDTDQIKTHLLHSILICIYSVRWSAQHYKQSNTLIFPLHHFIAWLNATMCGRSMLGAHVLRPDSTTGCNNVTMCLSALPGSVFKYCCTNQNQIYNNDTKITIDTYVMYVPYETCMISKPKSCFIF